MVYACASTRGSPAEGGQLHGKLLGIVTNRDIDFVEAGKVEMNIEEVPVMRYRSLAVFRSLRVPHASCADELAVVYPTV